MDLLPKIFLAITLLLMGAFALRMGYKFYKNHYAKPVTVWAKVLSKHTVEFYNKSMTGQTASRYLINFSVEGKRVGLYASAGLYHSCRVGDRGELTYQGDRVIDFSTNCETFEKGVG